MASTNRQYKDSEKFAWYGVLGMVIILIIVMLLSSCNGTYYITDTKNNTQEYHCWKCKKPKNKVIIDGSKRTNKTRIRKK